MPFGFSENSSFVKEQQCLQNRNLLNMWQCRSAGEITYRKMFGEYGLYCGGKLFALVCDDEFFVKITPKIKERYPVLPEKPPYDGAKNYFLVEDVDDREFLTAIVTATCAALPEPKPKKPKAKKEK